jgi:hypothetical protein
MKEKEDKIMMSVIKNNIINVKEYRKKIIEDAR